MKEDIPRFSFFRISDGVYGTFILRLYMYYFVLWSVCSFNFDTRGPAINEGRIFS
jgi:hypothetical protein